MLNQLLDKLRKPESVINLSGLRGSSAAWLAGLLSHHMVCCCIVPDEQSVAVLAQDSALFTDHRILTYPGYEIPPYTPLSPDQRTTATRLSTLYKLNCSSEHLVLIVSVEALMRRVLPGKSLNLAAEPVMAGEETDREQLLTTLIRCGYNQVSLVQTPGDFSVRGGIIDIFPPSLPDDDAPEIEAPVRLDFFGDTVESLRLFDPISQRSLQELGELTILPVSDIIIDETSGQQTETIIQSLYSLASDLDWDREQLKTIIDHVKSGRRFAGMEFFLPLFYGELQTDTVLDYLPQDTKLIVIDPENCSKSMDLVNERISANFQTAVEQSQPALPPDALFLSPKHLNQAINKFSHILCSDFFDNSYETIQVSSTNHMLLKQHIERERKKRGLVAPLSEQITEWQNQGDTVVVCCRSSRHTKNLANLLAGHHHNLEICTAPISFPENQTSSAKTLLLCDHPLSSGFSLLTDKLHFISESELFGAMRLGSKTKTAKQKGEPINFTEMSPGDVVVHREHGLGYYQGLITMEIQNVINDFMLIEYKGGDKLYLPVDRLNLISRYEGLSDNQPRIDKLGSQSWQTAKAKVKEEVWKVAQELLDIYARRELRTGISFSTPGELFHELEESFPFDETPGQHKAINEVIDDLTSDQPTDRLICGDVGYGKTEVAVRAAFKVVEDGFQVAILVPTTVLAEQHGATFKERMEGFPVTVECINRFRTPATQRKILKDLGAGKIDILIGTHRLLSKDVAFQKLGLLIVDEEHRFGVSHKEKIKKLKSEVDILTLTATPIPRTLQMSLLGIRDLSVISSPPEHRRPVKTFVARYDDLVIKEGITREMQRGGQVFFVHNRVKSINKMASVIQKLVPDARIAIAHGQMGGKELEAIMVAFVNKEIDVLVCTTIIESGLDIPSANTMIINRADRLGLAEIYQLRGRVGRSTLQAFAYLLVPSMESLSQDSKERLRALMDCNQLGGGFKLAMSDLQIRGGGNLLGVSQSGHIAAIGYDLYLDLLQRTVADLKSRLAAGDSTDTFLVADEADTEINLQLSAYIPDSYIADTGQRYIAYRRISSLATAEGAELLDLQDEFVDRYGPLPKETINLFSMVSLKKELAGLKISKLEKGKDTLVFSFTNDTPLSPELMLQYLATQSKNNKKNPSRITPDGRLIVTVNSKSDQALFMDVRKYIVQLQSLTS